jgi:NAD+ synthase
MFDVKKEVENITNFIKEYFKNNNLKGVVLGISGGKDSTVVAGLFARALGSENVLGVTLPCHSHISDKSDASLVAEKFGFELINLDLTPVYDSFISEVNKLGNFSEEELKNSNINIKPRLRMSSVYYLAALYSALKGGTYIVAGTSNKCELYVGYFTKGGDSTYDIGVLNNYTVDEVIKIGEYLEVPDVVIHKIPSDGLSGLSDEDKLGVKYKDIASVMNGEEIDEVEKQKILRLHLSSQHKFNIPVYNRD